MSAKVTVVVVSWNGAHLLSECLASLAAQTRSPNDVRLLVVDNASGDGTAELLARDHPHVDVLRSDRNRGFAGGAAHGLDAVETPYAVLINNDAVAEPGMLDAFVAALEAPGAERVGAVTGKVLLAADGRINSTGNLVARTGRGYDRDWCAPDDGSRPAGEVFGFCGAAAALRMVAVREVGGFDARLFLYYEDTDLSWRLRAAGWTVRYEPTAVARHRHATTSRAGSPSFVFWNERNSLLVFTRNAPVSVVLSVLIRRVVGLLLNTVRSGWRDPVTRARWRAAAAYAKQLPRTLRERREGWRDAAVPRGEVAALLTARPGT